MENYNHAQTRRYFEKYDIYHEAYDHARERAHLEAFNSAVVVLKMKDIVIKMHKEKLSIEKISLYTDLEELVVKKIIKNADKEFDFEVLKEIVKLMI